MTQGVMEKRNSPKILTTKRCVKYRQSLWGVREFEVWSGEMICRVAVLRMENSVLVWIGGREARLYDMAIAFPPEGSYSAVSTVLLGAQGSAAGLACRLAQALRKPTHVCCGETFDRFTAPLVDRAIAAEIKHSPEYF